jgi:tetratricopeptide (TPR) repeat protein
LAHNALGNAYYNTGKYKDAIESYEQARRNDTTSDYSHIRSTIGTNLSRARSAEEIEKYKEEVRRNPNDALAHNNLGRAYYILGNCQDEPTARSDSCFNYKFGKHQEAIELYKQAQIKSYRQAIESHKQAIKIDPDKADYHIKLGNVYGELDMHKEMIDAYTQPIRIDPDDAEAHSRLGSAYRKLGTHEKEPTGSYKKAIGPYKQAIKIDPDKADYHSKLGQVYSDLVWVYYRKKDYLEANKSAREAIESHKHATELRPDYSRYYLDLGQAYLLLGDKSSALDQYKILKKLEPMHAKMLFSGIYSEFVDKVSDEISEPMKSLSGTKD